MKYLERGTCKLFFNSDVTSNIKLRQEFLFY